jgi:hypothetical protein
MSRPTPQCRRSVWMRAARSFVQIRPFACPPCHSSSPSVEGARLVAWRWPAPGSSWRPWPVFVPVSAGRLLLLSVVLGAQAVISGVGRYRSAAVLTHRGLTVRGFWSATSLAWTDVASVARVRDHLLVALRRGTVFRLGPFAAQPGSDRYHRAQEMGAAVTVLRDRASAVGGSGQPVSARLSVGPAVLGAYAFVTVVAMWLGTVLR